MFQQDTGLRHPPWANWDDRSPDVHAHCPSCSGTHRPSLLPTSLPPHAETPFHTLPQHLQEEEQEEDLPEYVPEIMGGQDTLVIAHRNGVFHHGIQWCAFLGSAPHHIQLFRHGLFSASVIHPKTAFTFAVLDHFYMDAMECKTDVLSFFQKLRSSQI